MATNDDQAAALVAALAPLLSKTLLPELQKQVEDQVKGIAAKNQELLDKLAAPNADDETAAHQKRTDDLVNQAKRLNGEPPKDAKGNLDFRKAGEPVKISRTDARDVAKYRRAKELAAEQKVTLEIAED